MTAQLPTVKRRHIFLFALAEDYLQAAHLVPVRAMKI